jgi:hypothetical protein
VFWGRAVATGYVQRLGFFVIEYITFQGGQKRSNTERTIRSTDVADEGRGRVVGNYFFSAVRFSFEVREREAVRGYVQRSKFLASEYISFSLFQGGQMCPRSVYYDLLVYVSG